MAAAGSTATAAGVGAGATSDATAAAGAVADSAPDTNDRAVGLGDSGVSTVWMSASAATLARCTVCVTSLSDDGVGSDDAVGFVDGVVDDTGITSDGGVGSGEPGPADGVELAGATTSGAELVDALVAGGVEEVGVLSWSAEEVCDVFVDSAAAAGLVWPLVEDELCVLRFVSDGLVDVEVGESPGPCVEVDGPLDVPSFDVLGPRLGSEPVPLLGEDELPGLSEPVPSA